MAKLRFNRNFNINRVVKRLTFTILALYVGGTIMSVFGTAMNGSCSPFYSGLTLIGWKTKEAYGDLCGASSKYTLYDTTSSTGVLAVIGLIGIAGVVMEFISFN